MKILNYFAGLIALLCLTSCASEHAITQPAVSAIRPGITTEAELRQHFGPPDTWLKNNRGESSFAWFRSLGPNAGGYVPILGEALGGLNLEVQQLSVVVGPSGRVRSYQFYDSNGMVKTQRGESTRVDYRK